MHIRGFLTAYRWTKTEVASAKDFCRYAMDEVNLVGVSANRDKFVLNLARLSCKALLQLG